MAAKRLGKKDRELTSREQSILDFIRQKVWEDGFPPTVREICQAVGLRSTSTVHGYLARLEELGVIKGIRPAPELSKLSMMLPGVIRR